MLDLLQSSRGRSRGTGRAPFRQESGGGRGRGLLAFRHEERVDLTTTPPRPSTTSARTDARRSSKSASATDAGARMAAGPAGLVSIHYKRYNEYLVILDICNSSIELFFKPLRMA